MSRLPYSTLRAIYTGGMERFWKGLDRIKGKERLNEIFYYDVENSNLFIHMDERPNLSLFQKRSAYLEGLSQLAEDLERKPELQHIDFIIAGSWIVKNSPRLAQMIGFTAFTDVSDEKNIDAMTAFGIKGMKHDITEDDEGMAAISREDFLKRPWERGNAIGDTVNS